MKKIILLALMMILTSANAAEVCKIASSPGSDPNLSASGERKLNICIARALCTDPSLYIEKTEYLVFSDIELACTYAEAKLMKELLNLGYKLETSDTLVKY